MPVGRKDDLAEDNCSLSALVGIGEVVRGGGGVEDCDTGSGSEIDSVPTRGRVFSFGRMNGISVEGRVDGICLSGLFERVRPSPGPGAWLSRRSNAAARARTEPPPLLPLLLIPVLLTPLPPPLL